MENLLEDPISAACGEIISCQSSLLRHAVSYYGVESLTDAILKATQTNEYSSVLERELCKLLLIAGRMAFACHSSTYSEIARLYGTIYPCTLCDSTVHADLEDIRTIAKALPRILQTIICELDLLPPSAYHPEFGDIGIDHLYGVKPDFQRDPEGAAEWEKRKAEIEYRRRTGPIFAEESVSNMLHGLKRAQDAYEEDSPARPDDANGILFELLEQMVEDSAEGGYYRIRDNALIEDDVEWVHVNTPELERQKLIIEQTMALVDAIRDYVGRRKSSCAADLMKLEPMLKAQEDGVHQVGFTKQLKALMDALWRESVTPEKPVVVVGGGTGGGLRPGPKMSSAKKDQLATGVRDIENGRFKTPAEAAAHIVQLPLPQWKDEGYTEKNRASLAQAIRRELQRAKRKKSLGAK